MDEPDAGAPVHLTRIDVGFLDLVAFFVKASFAGAIAFLVTSWLWVLLATGVGAASAGLLVLAGVPGWLTPAPPVPVPAPPAPAPVAFEPPPTTAVVVLEAPRGVTDVTAAADATAARDVTATGDPAADLATEAAQLAEIERMRRERARRP